MAIGWLVAGAACGPRTAEADGVAASAAEVASDAARGVPPVILPVATVAARTGDLVLLVATSGQVLSEAAVTLRAETGGTVRRTPGRPGARATQGQPLVELEPYPFALAVREAQAAYDEADQRYRDAYLPDSLVRGVGPTDVQRAALQARAGLTGARLRVERAQYDLARASVTSPFDGVVDAVHVAPGERVAPGTPLVTVVDTRRLRVEAQVLEHDLPLVREGGQATVTSVGNPGRPVQARIETVLPLVDSVTRTGRAVVRIANGAGVGTLRPGMHADVMLEAVRLPRRLLVPARAVVERDGRTLVFVVRGGRAQWTYIVPGRSNGLDTEVLADSATGRMPLRAGDTVVVEGQLTLTHDARVRATPVTGPVTVAAPVATRRD